VKQIPTPSSAVLINSRALVERLVDLTIDGKLDWPTVEFVIDHVLEMENSPLEARREEAFMALRDGVSEAAPSAGDDSGLGMVPDLDDVLMRLTPRPVEIEREPEPLVLGTSQEGAELFAGADVERGRDHRASGGEQARSECATDAARDGRAITLVVLQRCGMDALGDVTLEAELAREMTLGDLTFLVDLRAKWKRDAILGLSRRLQEAAKQI
jgi:hypothetical protein